MRLKVSSAKWRPFCLGLNVLKRPTICKLGNLHSLMGRPVNGKSSVNLTVPVGRKMSCSDGACLLDFGFVDLDLIDHTG